MILEGNRVKELLWIRSVLKNAVGKPDIVLSRFRTVIFAHGCFWHRHSCKRATTPASNTDYWNAKFAKTTARDAMNRKLLEKEGWRVLTLWECELKEASALRARLQAALPSTSTTP
jgi:DNA mismatch endonuclease (patch repair protein)